MQSADSQFPSNEQQTGTQIQTQDQQFVVMRKKQPNQKVFYKIWFFLKMKSFYVLNNFL